MYSSRKDRIAGCATCFANMYRLPDFTGATCTVCMTGTLGHGWQRACHTPGVLRRICRTWIKIGLKAGAP